MKHGVTAVPGALPWMAWLEDDRQEIVASSYHRTRESAELAAPFMRWRRNAKSGSRPARPAPATERSNAMMTQASPPPRIFDVDVFIGVGQQAELEIAIDDTAVKGKAPTPAPKPKPLPGQINMED